MLLSQCDLIYNAESSILLFRINLYYKLNWTLQERTVTSVALEIITSNKALDISKLSEFWRS